jgi:hypothetical protein
MHRRGIGFVKGVGMSGIMGGAEWSGVERRDSHVCISYARKGGHVLVGDADAEKTDGWDEGRGVAMHQISLTDLGLDGCCLVDTYSLPAAYTGTWYIAVMVLCEFFVSIFSPVVLRSFFSLRSCGLCIAVCFSASLSAEA